MGELLVVQFSGRGVRDLARETRMIDSTRRLTTAWNPPPRAMIRQKYRRARPGAS